MYKFMQILGCLSLATITTQTMAQTADSLPDPETISVPDISGIPDKKIQKKGYKFFYFYNPDVSFAEAYEDLSECRRHLVVGTGAYIKLPGFVPWVEPVRRKVAYGPNPYGLVGVAMAALIMPDMQRGYRNNIMRICMGPRGYSRYALSKDDWRTVNQGEDEQILLMQAKLASGAKPQGKEVIK